MFKIAMTHIAKYVIYEAYTILWCMLIQPTRLKDSEKYTPLIFMGGGQRIGRKKFDSDIL